MKIATADLKVGWAISYAAGSEVPDEVLETPLAKKLGWPELVANPKTKAAQQAQESPPARVA